MFSLDSCPIRGYEAFGKRDRKKKKKRRCLEEEERSQVSCVKRLRIWGNLFPVEFQMAQRKRLGEEQRGGAEDRAIMG